MKFIKEHLCDLPFCYAVSQSISDGSLEYILATDDTGPCYSIDAKTNKKETVWEEPGGTMSIIPLPGGNGDFLASQCFLPGFSALNARIVKVSRQNGRWHVVPWLDLPYVHRFDILERNGVRYLLACILTTTDQPQADWACPGKLIAAELSSDFAPPEHFITIAKGMTHNHGYFRAERAGYAQAYTACDEGIFEVTPPEQKGGKWLIRKILNVRASDVALCDINGDGAEELAVIEPFHGTDFVVYQKTIDGYQEIYRYPEKMAFTHVVWGGNLCGEPVFLGGCREEGKEFFVLRWKNGAIQSEIIENGYGPSNVAVFRNDGQERILVANRESAEGALFTVTKD